MWHRTHRAGVVTVTTRCLQQGAAGSTWGRRPTLPYPATFRFPGDQRWHHKVGQPHTPHRSQHTGPGSWLQRQGPNWAPAGGPKAQSPMCIQKPKILGNKHQSTPCQYLSGDKKGPLRATKGQQLIAGPIYDSQGGTPEPWLSHLSPALFHKHQAWSSQDGSSARPMGVCQRRT